MSKKYLSILSALMLIGSSFISAMEYTESYGLDSKKMSVAQDQSFEPKSEFGAFKGKTKLPGKKSKACKEALKKCQEFNDCEDLKQCQKDGWKDYGDGTVGFSQTVVGNPELNEPKTRTIHGKPNPYVGKARNLDIKAGYLPNKRIGSEKWQEELEFFDKIPETAEKTVTQKDMLKKSNWDFESEHIGKNTSPETEDLFDNVQELDIDD